MKPELENFLQLIISSHTPEELALGWLRYEAMRKADPTLFGELAKLDVRGPVFDSIVDDSFSEVAQALK